MTAATRRSELTHALGWWKLTNALAAITLGSTALAYTLADSPFPRPTFVFAGVAIALGLLCVGAIAPSRASLATGALVAILAAIWLRASAFVRVISSGLDHGRWLNHVTAYVDAGGVIGTDMYAASPLYILELVVARGVFDGPIFSTRFLTITIASLLPVLVGLLAYRLTGEVRVGYVAVLLAVAQPLFIRTSTLLEAESMALPWFVLGVYLFVRSTETNNYRYYALFLLVAGSTVMLHALYGAVISLTLVGTIGAMWLLQRLELRRLPLFRPSAQVTVLVLAVVTFHLAWILTSVYAPTAIDVFLRMWDSVSIPPEFFPGTGAAAESTGQLSADSEGAQGPFARIASLYPVVALAVVAVVGGIEVLRSRRSPGYSIGVLLTGAVGLMTVSALTVTVGGDFHFRLYYFLSVFVILFAAIALSDGLDIAHWQTNGRARAVAVAVIALFVFSYAFAAPMSPFGNNVDPGLGGTSWATTETGYAQLQSVDVLLEGSEPIGSDLTATQLHDSLLPTSANEDLSATADTCGDGWAVSDAGAYVVCLDHHTGDG